MKFDLTSLLTQGRGTELHWFPEDVPVTQLAAVMAAMANTSGGTLLVGVAPRRGKLLGVADPPAVLDKIFQAALLTDPPLVLPMPQVQETEGNQVVILQVPHGLPHVYSLEGRFLGREGTQSNPIPARRLRQILIERGIVQFESLIPPGACLEDLDLQRVAGYIERLNLTGAVTEEEFLQRRGCLKKSNDNLQPTYAGVLLFGKHPQQWLPNATILAARFSGTSFADRYIKQDFSGTLPDQLRQAEIFVRENLPTEVRMSGLTHEEQPQYPEEAVRELLVNAVAHRDYNQGGDTIHLNVFADRIEVHSPGKLPGPMNLKNLLQARFSRNAILVQVLSDLGYVERLGYGLDRVVRAMRQRNLPAPRFEEVAGSFRVTLFAGLRDKGGAHSLPDLSAYREMNLNHRQEMALSYLQQNRRITNRDFQELCPDVHAETLRRDLANLVSRHVLIKVGDKRATYYILKT